MARLVLSLGLVMILHLGALAQVDTLRFEEINNFSTADRIYNTYFQDINNDNSIEMIICQASWIDIYNPLNGDRLWTSPPLGHNSSTWQAQFGDLNSDGYPDLVAIDPSATDSSHIKVFDVIHDGLIWTSPNYFHLPKICTIGDRNSDGINDIIVFTRGEKHYQNVDTAWVDIYDGPTFQLSTHQNFSILSDWVPDPDFYLGFSVQRQDELYKAAVIDFSSNGQPQPKIVLFLNESRYGSTYDGVYIFTMRKYDGNYNIFDPIFLTNIYVTGYGSIQSSSLNENGQGNVSLISHTKYSWDLDWYDPYGGEQGGYGYTTHYSEYLSEDGNLTYTEILHYDSHNLTNICTNGIVGEIDPANDGQEICFGVADSLKLFSFPAATQLWSNSQSHARYRNYYLFHLSSALGPPQILCDEYNWRDPWSTFNGTTGEFSAIFPYDTLFYASIRAISDLNNDGDDEIITIPTITNVQILHAINTANGIEEIAPIPSSFRLYSAYPNPFNASTSIQYDLIEDSPVNIGIYNILGQRVATLVNQNQPAGHHQVIWNAGGVSSGIYFYKLSAGDYSETKKMVVMR